jgi:hypothetical protein
MQEYESVLLSKAVIEMVLGLKKIVQHTDQPTINDIVLAMATDYHILAESDVALVFNGFEYEMIDKKEIEGK